MPALNFQAQFAPLVESGEKRQTIRAYRKDGRDPTPGCKLYFFTGMRTKACRPLIVERSIDSLRRLAARHGLFGRAVECKSVTPIAIDWSENPWRATKHIVYSYEVWTGELGEQYRSRLSDRRLANLARADGFNCAAAMLAWFEKTHGLPFEGLLIRW